MYATIQKDENNTYPTLLSPGLEIVWPAQGAQGSLPALAGVVGTDYGWELLQWPFCDRSTGGHFVTAEVYLLSRCDPNCHSSDVGGLPLLNGDISEWEKTRREKPGGGEPADNPNNCFGSIAFCEAKAQRFLRHLMFNWWEILSQNVHRLERKKVCLVLLLLMWSLLAAFQDY